MKHTAKLFTLALLLTASSCNLLRQNNSHKIEYISEPITEEQSSTAKKSPNTVPDQKNRVRGEWIVLSASGQELTNTENRTYVNFSAKEGKIYGNTGCNTVNGRFCIGENNTIRFADLLSTMKYCDNANDERLLLDGLHNAASFAVYKQDGLYYLNVKDSANTVVLHMKRHNADVLTGTWTVTAIDRQEIADTGIQLVIDIPELKLHGNAGCNIINGTIGLDRNKDWFIQFQSIASTRKLCDEKTMKIERDLLVALEEVEYIRRINSKEVRLTDKNGNEILHLKRLDLKSERK